MSTHVQVALARKTLSAWGMGIFGAAASAPLVVLAGGIVATYASTQVTSVPLVFLLVGGVVALLLVGYTAMSRQVPHAAAYYAILAQGLGRSWGVAGGVVALVAYNAIQISLYGLLGATLASLIGGNWWAWAGAALVLVAVFGVRAVALSTALLTAVLAGSLVIVALFGASAVADPAAGTLSWEGFSPAGLGVSGIGGAVALCLAALMGVDAPASFAEESRDEGAITRAVFAGVLFLTVVYAGVAWAMGVAVGPDQVAAVAADPNGGLPFSVLEQRLGGLMTPLAQMMLIFAIVTSLLAFHSVAARYAFAMAREGVLPAALARSGSGTRVSAPVGGSLLQTGIAVAVVGVFAVLRADPMATLFTWLSTLGALGLLCLLVSASVAAMASRTRLLAGAGVLTSVIAPLFGVVFGVVVLAAMVVNVGSLLGAASGSLSPYLLPVIIAAAGLGGGLWAVALRRMRPETYEGISRGRPDTHAVPDDVGVTF
ncbi:amino acid/polyamine/organocation transporter, APC superfamily [Micromonospora citrea]|uniref:Amino acid/polyamine/organocation transporter, APC superfamily n=1 Tax=Micromonospora citrea TaxID=47855 RepID=A0A1C6URB6_9ACTN|nr:APC family permease [Micromonospora citrea]SCL56349.1 amino acid/polyamine/organocation transporter, APC superfamily [Micromonospora citrea]